MYKSLIVVFTIIGAIASTVSAAVALIKVLPSDSVRGTVVEELQVKMAKKLAPEGFDVQPAFLEVILPGEEFDRARGESAFLTDKKIPFTAKYGGLSDRVEVLIDGESFRMVVGDTMMLPGGDCNLWFYSVKKKKKYYSFLLRCNGET